MVSASFSRVGMEKNPMLPLPLPLPLIQAVNESVAAAASDDAVGCKVFVRCCHKNRTCIARFLWNLNKQRLQIK
jgi:hypothetical protein